MFGKIFDFKKKDVTEFKENYLFITQLLIKRNCYFLIVNMTLGNI